LLGLRVGASPAGIAVRATTVVASSQCAVHADRIRAVFAARVPGNHFKAKLGHPQVLAVKVWAFGHLLATGMLHDVVLFGAFLVWAIILFAVSRRRDRLAGATYPPGTVRGDALTLLIGVVAWVIFAGWLHLWLIGVSPMG